MLSSDWWAATGLIVYCIVSTAAGCWAIDRFTGAKIALEKSKNWERGKSLDNTHDSEGENEI